MSGKVLWHVTMSVDGFITGPNDAMDWVLGYEGPNPVVDEVIKSTGAILAGRRWYDLATVRWNGVKGIYGGGWSGPVFVVTHRPPRGSHDPAVTFLSDAIENAVATALAAANGRNVVLLGSTIPRQCLAAGLLDDLIIHVAPILLGDGIRLYGETGAPSVRLEPVSVGRSEKLVDLRFRVVKYAEVR